MSITRIQTKTGEGASTTMSFSFTSDVTTGSCIIVMVGVFGGNNIAGCTDNAGNTYSESAQSDGGSLSHVRIFYSTNVTGRSGFVVTVTASSGYWTGVAVEYGGVLNNNPIQGSYRANGSSTRAQTDAIISGDNNLLLMAMVHEGGSFSLTEDEGTVLFEEESASVVYPGAYIEISGYNDVFLDNIGWTISNTAAWTLNAVVLNANVVGGVTPAPTAFHVSATGISSVSATWMDNASDETGFELQYATHLNFSDAVTITIDTANTTSSVAVNLEPGWTYYWRVRAVGPSGNSDWADTEVVTMPEVNLSTNKANSGSIMVVGIISGE